MAPTLWRLALGGTAAALLTLGAVLALRSTPEAPPPLASAPPLPPPPATSVAAPVPPPPPPARPIATASPGELAVVAPLAPGSDLGGFAVREIRGVEKGRLRVVCERGREVVRLDVALDAPAGAPPPARAGKYAIYYALDGATPDDGERLAKALAVVIGRSGAAPPPGMTPFVPGPKPPTPL